MSHTATDSPDALSERERDVLTLIAEGKTNQEIADSLYLAVTTVKWYNTQIYEKLSVRNRKEAVAVARASGLLTTPDAPIHQISGPSSHLPRPATPFIGRAVEVDEVTHLLHDPTMPIVTILGPGGMGKTRLALHVAHQQVTAYRDGVFFVPLAGVESGDHMLAAIAEATRAPMDPEMDAKSAILAYFERLSMLLVLDNVEHLLADAAFITEISRHAPNVQVLVTSRERLNLSGEHVYILGGLALPEVNTAVDSDAVRLFVQSAQRGRPDFSLTPQAYPMLARILSLTQGMPLAIELAAGWIDMLTLPQIADEIQQGMDILETELRDIPDRHRSIRATIQASWDRLRADEREVFMRLSVFRAPFDYEAAQTIAGANLRNLRKLVDKALLYALPGGRYTIHELLRQFGVEQLATAGQIEATQDAYMRYFARVLSRMEAALLDLDPNAERTLNVSHDDLVATWGLMAAGQHIDLIAECVESAHRYFNKGGRNYDGYELFKQATQMIEARPSFATDDNEKRVYCHLRVWLVQLVQSFNAEYSQTLLDETIALLETLPDVDDLLALAYTQISKGRYIMGNRADQPDALVAKALEVSDRLTDPMQLSNSLIWSAWMFMEQGEYAATSKRLDRIQNIMDIQGLPRSLCMNYYFIKASLASQLGDDDTFQHFIHMALEIAEDSAELYALGHARGSLCEFALEQGNHREAAQHMIAYIRLHVEKGRDWQTLGALTGVTKHFYLKSGNDEMVVAIMGFVQHYPQSAHNLRTEARALLLNDVARDSLDDATYTAAFERYQDYSLQQMVAVIIADLETV